MSPQNVLATKDGNVLCDVLEIEVAIIPKKPAGECDEELSKRGVNIYEIGGFDVFGGEFAEVDFVEPEGREVSTIRGTLEHV